MNTASAPPEHVPAAAPAPAVSAPDLFTGALTSERVLAMQRTAGNASVSRFLTERRIQRLCRDGQSTPPTSETDPTSQTVFSVALRAATGGYEGVNFTITNRDCELRLGYQMQGERGGRSGAAPGLVEDLLTALRWCYAEAGEFRIVLARNSQADLMFSSWEPLQRFTPSPGVARSGQGQNVVVVMGSPSPDQARKLQFITAGLRESGNTIWFVERTGYELAGVDLTEITSRAPGGRTRWVTPQAPLADQLNALPVGSVRRIVVYSHGVQGFVTLRYGWGGSNADYGLNRDDARRVNGAILSPDGMVDLESCQGGTSMDGGSLAQVLADTTGREVQAWTGRTSYADVNAGRGGVRGSEYGFNSDALREWWVRNWVAGDTPREVTFRPQTARMLRRAPAAETTAAPTSDKAVDALDLKPKAKAAANTLKNEFPSISFTSGKRDDVSEQARAMAGNVVSNRNWITETYSDKVLAAKLQKWLDDNPKATTKEDIAKGLADTMATWSEAEKGRLSAHFSGEAFDIQPQTDKADEIKARADSLAEAQGGKFLEKEGGLVRWHAQIRE